MSHFLLKLKIVLTFCSFLPFQPTFLILVALSSPSSFPTYLSYSLAEYFTTTGSEGLQNHQQQGSQRDNHTDQEIGLTFTNPTALSFELQSNPSYNQPLPSLPPSLPSLLLPPSYTEEPQTNSDLWASSANEGQPLSSSVMIADNPQYRQFYSSNQPHNNSTGGVARVIMSAEVSEGEYDYIPGNIQSLSCRQWSLLSREEHG